MHSRYHALLRDLSSSPAMRLAILSSTVRFWALAPQWVQIVFDKLLQYRIVEPADIIDFVFAPPRNIPALVLLGSGDGVAGSFSRVAPPEAGGLERDWSTFSWWDIVRITVDKVNGRVEQVRKRLETLEREEADEADRKAAAEAAGAEEPQLPAEPEFKLPLFPGASLPPRPQPSPVARAAAAQATQKEAVKKANGTSQDARAALDAISVEQRKVLVGATQGFVRLVRATAPTLAAAGELDEATPNEAWQAWWVRAWYRNFLRLVSGASACLARRC